MADENSTPDAGDAVGESADDGARAKKKKLLLFGGIGLVVVAAGGGGAFFLLRKGGSDKPTEVVADAHEGAEAPAAGHEAAAASSEHGKPKDKPDAHGGEKKAGEHGGGKEEKSKDAKGNKDKEAEEDINIDFGQTYLFQPFHMNLGNPLENRYVRLEVSVEYRGGDTQKAEIERRLPQLRDAIVSIATKKTREFLLAPDGKDQLRKEIKTRLNRYMSKPVESVFITDILIE